MKYENIIKQLENNMTYTRAELYQKFFNENKKLSYNSFKWILSDMVRSGILSRKQRGVYMLSDSSSPNKCSYQPEMGEYITRICKLIENKFPAVDFVCFESIQLNEFLNHLIAKNTYFIFVERDILDSVFRFLQEEKTGNILFKPGPKEWDIYWSGNNDIVMLSMISEVPKVKEGSHIISIEQLLVDIVAEKSFKALRSDSEVQRIYEQADKNYKIDYARLLRYARRRGKAELIQEYIKDYINAQKR